jgi:hypothetical protein
MMLSIQCQNVKTIFRAIKIFYNQGLYYNKFNDCNWFCYVVAKFVTANIKLGWKWLTVTNTNKLLQCKINYSHLMFYCASPYLLRVFIARKMFLAISHFMLSIIRTKIFRWEGMAPTNLLFSAFHKCHLSNILNFWLEQSKLACLENVLKQWLCLFKH